MAAKKRPQKKTIYHPAPQLAAALKFFKEQAPSETYVRFADSNAYCGDCVRFVGDVDFNGYTMRSVELLAAILPLSTKSSFVIGEGRLTINSEDGYSATIECHETQEPLPQYHKVISKAESLFFDNLKRIAPIASEVGVPVYLSRGSNLIVKGSNLYVKLKTEFEGLEHMNYEFSPTKLKKLKKIKPLFSGIGYCGNSLAFFFGCESDADSTIVSVGSAVSEAREPFSLELTAGFEPLSHEQLSDALVKLNQPGTILIEFAPTGISAGRASVTNFPTQNISAKFMLRQLIHLMNMFESVVIANVPEKDINVLAFRSSWGWGILGEYKDGTVR